MTPQERIEQLEKDVTVLKTASMIMGESLQVIQKARRILTPKQLDTITTITMKHSLELLLETSDADPELREMFRAIKESNGQTAH